MGEKQLGTLLTSIMFIFCFLFSHLSNQIIFCVQCVNGTTCNLKWTFLVDLFWLVNWISFFVCEIVSLQLILVWLNPKDFFFARLLFRIHLNNLSIEMHFFIYIGICRNQMSQFPNPSLFKLTYCGLRGNVLYLTDPNYFKSTNSDFFFKSENWMLLVASGLHLAVIVSTAYPIVIHES